MQVLSLKKHMLTKFHIRFRNVFFRPSVFRESILEFILLTVLAVLKMNSRTQEDFLVFLSLTFIGLIS